MNLTRRALLGGGISMIAGAVLADVPLRSLRPVARPEAATATVAAAPSGLGPEARLSTAEMVSQARLGGRTGFVALDSRSGEILDQHDAYTRLPPASVTKAVTALYALRTLGPEFRFETALVATGPVVDGVLQGDLVLTGTGDPTLDTDALEAMAKALVATGLRRVTGAFKVWGGALPQQAQIDPVQLPHLGYNPAVSGLNLNYNRVYFAWERSGDGYDLTLDARGTGARPVVSLARMQLSDRRGPVFSYAEDGGVDSWTVARRALGDSGARWLPIRRPAAYAGEVFAALAKDAGLTLGPVVEATAAPKGDTLISHLSDDLTTICRSMLKWSTNLTAEQLGMAATAARGVPAADLAASARAMSTWVELHYRAAPRFVDHSGLGGGSRVSALQMARILTHPHAREVLRPLLKQIRLHDAKGEALPTPPGLVVAKTGTLNFVSALAGYERTIGGRDIAFAIFSGDVDRRIDSQQDEEERPEGAKSYNGRAKWLQQRLLRRWGIAYSAEPVN